MAASSPLPPNEIRLGILFQSPKLFHRIAKSTCLKFAGFAVTRTEALFFFRAIPVFLFSISDVGRQVRSASSRDSGIGRRLPTKGNGLSVGDFAWLAAAQRDRESVDVLRDHLRHVGAGHWTARIDSGGNKGFGSRAGASKWRIVCKLRGSSKQPHRHGPKGAKIT